MPRHRESLYRERGVVLRTVKLGETDRIVTILTEGRGKVRAVAKGVRKPGSRFGGRLEPSMHLALQCYEGRELDIVTQCEAIDVWHHLRDDYASITSALSMLEAADQLSQERQANVPLYQMLVRALRTLDDTPSPVVAAAFFWKLLSLEGYEPRLDVCGACEQPIPFEPDIDSVPILDLELGGAICRRCSGVFLHPLRPATYTLLRQILSGRLRQALDEPDGPAVREVEQLALRSLEHHLERRMRSAALLSSLHGSGDHWSS